MFQHSPTMRHITSPIEVFIPTATAIPWCAYNPYLVLIGDSTKHEKPVLPGGKIERQDMAHTALQLCAERTIQRELSEEIGTSGSTISLLSVSTDPSRDVRKITAKAIEGTIIDHTVNGLSPDTPIIARYGVPDFLFSVKVFPESLKNSPELVNLRWVDIRVLKEEDLSAGHGKFVKQYLASLENDRPKRSE